MSRRSLGTLTLDLIAQTGGFVQGMDKAQRESARWRKQVESDLKKVSGEAQVRLGRVAVAAGGVVTALGAVAVLGFRNVDSQAKLARSLDTTYDSVTALQMAFGDAGINNFEGSLNRLNRRLGAAELGRGSALKAVQELGLNLRELAQLEADERLARIADRIREVSTNSQQAARYAQDLGFEQREAAQFFLQGGDAIRAYRQEVDQFRLALSAIETARVEQANDALGIMGDAAQMVQQRLAVGLAPAVTRVADHITDSFRESADTMQSDMDRAIRAAVGNFAEMVDSSATVLEVIQDNPMSAQFGVLGWLLLGPKGALIGAAIGATFEIIKEGLASVGVGISDAEDSARRLATVQAAIQQQEELMRSARALDTDDSGAQRRAAAQQMIREAEAELAALRAAEAELQLQVESSSEAQDHYNQIINRGTDQASGFAGAMRRLADSLRDIDWDAAGPDGQPGGGISGAIGTEDEAELDSALARRRDAIRQSFETEKQAVLRIFGQQEQEIRELRDAGVISKMEADSLMWQNERQMFEKRQELRQKELDAQKGYWEKWLDSAQKNLQNFDELSKTVIDNFTTGFGNAIEGLVFDAENLDEALRGVAETILRGVVNSLAQMAAQWLALQAVQMLLGTKATAASMAQAGVSAAAWAPAAAAASLATMGANAAPAAISLTTTHALSKSLSLMGMAHEGLDSVPATGTWLLEKGERVTTAETSAKLDATLERVNQNVSTGGIASAIIQQEIHVGASTDEGMLQAVRDAARQGAEDGYRAVYDDVRKNGPIRQMIRSN